MKLFSAIIAMLFVCLSSFTTKSKKVTTGTSYGVITITYPQYGVTRYYLKDLKSVWYHTCEGATYYQEPCQVLVEGTYPSNGMVDMGNGNYYIDVNTFNHPEVITSYVGHFYYEDY